DYRAPDCRLPFLRHLSRARVAHVEIPPTHRLFFCLNATRCTPNVIESIHECSFQRCRDGLGESGSVRVRAGLLRDRGDPSRHAFRVEGDCSEGKLSGMTDVTQILAAVEAGDPKAAAELLPLVYDELRKLAAARLADEKPGQTLQATALVNEAYIRLVGGEHPQDWNSRGHFFAAAAEAMRRILVERARHKG